MERVIYFLTLQIIEAGHFSFSFFLVGKIQVTGKHMQGYTRNERKLVKNFNLSRFDILSKRLSYFAPAYETI